LVVISGDAIPNIYKGSIGRGDFGSNILNDIFITCNEMIIWTGEASITREDPANWFCGVVPGPQHVVFIPWPRIRYPVINSNVTIKKLEVQPQASVSLSQMAELMLTGVEN
jgi:hypothetical protein